jgi:hypothetical protein
MFIVGNFNSKVTVTEVTLMDRNGSNPGKPREKHKKDQAIEEYVEQNPNHPTKGENDLPDRDEDGMGISKKAKSQPSDEGDTAKRK